MVLGRFYLSCLLLGSLGSMCILFTIYWMQYWRGGFAWNGSIYMFNWHPVLMVAGMVVFYGGASLVYRLPQSWVGPKLPWKLLHAALHLMAFILTVVGLVAVFTFHNHGRTANLYSLHSWLGITTVFLFACQACASEEFYEQGLEGTRDKQVVPGLCCLPPALGVHVAAQPPKTYPRLFWSRHPLSVHRIRHFRH
nr:lysosomal membrane ascorbate-dependent ferrireductase CYB561A3 isoform X2 [Gorilla gorilla gorilla]